MDLLFSQKKYCMDTCFVYLLLYWKHNISLYKEKICSIGFEWTGIDLLHFKLKNMCEYWYTKIVHPMFLTLSR